MIWLELIVFKVIFNPNCKKQKADSLKSAFYFFCYIRRKNIRLVHRSERTSINNNQSQLSIFQGSF